MAHNKKWPAVLLFGMPGSGKGTQGKAIGSVPGYLHVSSGDMFRQLNKVGPSGREVDRYTSEGKLVPDELTVSIWHSHLLLLRNKQKISPEETIFLLDGIPRTYQQAEMLDKELDVLLIFSLRLRDPEEAVQRIRERALKENRIDDASEAVIRGRIETFERQTLETLRFYPPSLVVEVDGSQSPMKVLHVLTTHLCNSRAEIRRKIA